ncbi:MAG: glycosyltransferase family 4 protein [Rhodobacteraceae bacterium]|nr:glycosyltransferase family 4 protein [Paracoccaceae bacterium]
MQAAFAIPGDLNTRTGGYIYERRMLETLNEIGLPTAHVALMPSWPHPTPAAEGELAEKLRALPPGTPLILDGLVFGSMDTGLLAALDLPVVAMLHHPLGLEAGLPPDVARALIARETANLRHADHVVVPSPHTKAILIRDFGVAEGDVSIALPGFDRPDPAAAPVPRADPPLILSVGILCERKGHDVLLAALDRLRDRRWQAAIVGLTHDPGVAAALRRQRADLGFDERVDFTGVIPGETLDRLWRQAHLFALATRYEGYGMVLSEALLYGLPVVSCAVGAVPDTLPEGAGILTPPDDPAAFAAALAHLLDDDAAHAAMAARARAEGAALPEWRDAARVMAGALARVSSGHKGRG